MPVWRAFPAIGPAASVFLFHEPRAGAPPFSDDAPPVVPRPALFIRLRKSAYRCGCLVGVCGHGSALSLLMCRRSRRCAGHPRVPRVPTPTRRAASSRSFSAALFHCLHPSVRAEYQSCARLPTLKFDAQVRWNEPISSVGGKMGRALA